MNARAEHRTLPPSPPFPTVLDTDACWHRVGTRQVGRIGYAGPGAPQIVPVTFVAQRPSIYFRTSAFGQVAHQVHGQRVAFEVDSIDEPHRTGWSIVLVGEAYRVADGDRLGLLWSEVARIEPWAGGLRNLWMAVDVDEVSGRTLVP